MNATPRCIRARKGKVIIFKITPKNQNAKDTVEIFPKDPANDWWLAGKNSPNKNRIIILVPEDSDVEESFEAKEYYYGFRTSTKCVDPRVSVEN